MMVGSLPTYVAADYPTKYNVAVYATTSAQNIEVYYCKFSNIYTSAVYCYSAQGTLIVSDCQFTSPQQNQGYYCQHVDVVTWKNVSVTNCSFINAAPTSPSFGVPAMLLALISGQTTVENNILDYCGRDNTYSHRLGAIDFYQEVSHFSVRNNYVTNCLESIMRVDSAKEGRLEGNYFTVWSLATTGYNGVYFQGFYGGSTKNVTVCNNVIDDSFNRLSVAIGVYAYCWQQPSQNINVYSNDIIGANYAFFVTNAFSNVLFKDNNITGYYSRVKVTKQFIFPYSAFGTGNESTGAMENLIISGNNIQPTFGLNSTQVDVSTYATSTYSQAGTTAVTFVAPYQTYAVGSQIALRFILTGGVGPVPAQNTYTITSVANSGAVNATFTVVVATVGTSTGSVDVGFTGAVNGVRINGNRIVGGGGAGSLGVYVDTLQTTAAKSGFVYAENNITASCDRHYYARNTYRFDLFNNSAQGAFTSYFTNGGNNYYIQRRFNSLSNESRQGTRTLVAGTATVVTAEIEAGDTVIVSRGTAGGTLGNLSVASIVPGSSFVINSDSATDTSTVFWEIVH
jgi:hypothetical protein